MNTLLVLTLIASAYGFVVTILWLKQKARRKQAEKDSAYFKKQWDSSESLSRDRLFLNQELLTNRDQLVQALKETQDKLDSIKVRRDPKTGRMVSAKRK